MADSQSAMLEAALMSTISDAKNALALEVAANLAEACPFDTGHARANFVPSVTVPFEGVVDGGAAIASGSAQVLAAKLADDVFVTNNVPYLPFLIAGSSSQAPPGWDLAAIDRAVASVNAQYSEVHFDTSGARTAAVTQRGASAASNVASAYSPFGGDE